MPFTTIQFDDSKLSLFQDNVNKSLIPLQNSPLSGGQLLVSIVSNTRVNYVTLTSGQDNLIAHTLGYTPTIILAFCPSANSTIWSPTTTSLNGSNASPTRVNLRCSTSCTVSVLVK